MKPRKRLGRPAAAGLALLLALNLALIGGYAAGLRINATASMPQGVYRLQRYEPGALARGTIVAICPAPEVVAVATARRYLAPGPCPGNVEPLLKHVAATAGDDVSVSDRGIRVNGEPLANSARLAGDCAGRPLPRIAPGRYAVGRDMVWLYAPVPRSWDSRYFGAQPATGIVGIATPVLIVGTGRACAS